MIRNRRFAFLLASIFGLSLLSCGREVTGPGDGGAFGWGRSAALALDPQFPQLPGADLASDLVPFVTVRVTLRGTDGAIVRDTVIDFPSTADSVLLSLDVPLPLTTGASGLPLSLSMAFVNAAGDTVFRGGPAQVTARPSGTPGASQPISIPVLWVPPGAVPASVVLTPTTGTVVAGTTTVFSATAFDAGGAPIPGTPIAFAADSSTRAVFATPGNGTATWLPNRGNVRIIASTLNLRADTSFFSVTLPASRLLAVSGGAQSAVIGTALAQPVVLRVTASDSVPVAGVPVTFAVTTGGGTLTALADTSDASGLVSTSWTLGSLVGAQSITAAATGIATATQLVTATGLAPVPTQLAITAAPTTAVAGATLGAVTVEVRDANNVRTPLFTGPVTLALNAGATGATLAGTATVNAVAGIATFNGLSIQRAAAGLSLTATSGALTSATTSAFTITPAAPAALLAVAGDAQSGTLGQALTDSVDVQLADAFANPIPGATIAFSVVTGGGSIAPTTAVTDANGRARAGWTLGTLVGAQSARAELNGVPAIFAALTATGVAGAPVRLEIVGEPSATQVAGAPFTPAIVVRAVDAVGATATAFTGTVSLALAANPTGATPSGTLTAAAVAGVATFNNVVLTTTGAGYTLMATSGALVPDTTVAFTVLNAAATQLTLVSGNAQSGPVITALPAPFVVRVTDGFGNGVPAFAVNWAITSAGGALSATATATDAGGFASTTLTLPSATGTATVQATAGGLTGSPQVFTATATAGAASQLVFTLNTGAGIAGATMAPGWVIEARDGLGNLVPGFSGPVDVVLSNGPGGTTLGGTTTVNAIGGVATFADLTIDRVAPSWVLIARSAGFPDQASAPFAITAAAPAAISVLTGGSQAGGVLAALADSVVFRVTDQYGNVTGGAPVTVAGTTGGGSVSPVGGVTDATGLFGTAWTLGSQVGAQSITATITTAPAAQAVANATATPGAAAALVLVTAIGPQIAGDTLPAVIVEVRDAAGNVATGFTGVVSGRIFTGPNGPDPDSLPVTAVAGVATFTGATFESAGDYTLRFNAVGLPDIFSGTITVSAAPASQMNVVGGNGQTGVAGQPLPLPVDVRIQDPFFNDVSGVPVSWVMLRGVDTLAVNANASAVNGLASWQPVLPTTVGPVQIVATSAGLVNSPITVVANVVGAATTQLTMFTQPVAGTALAPLPTSAVRARDQYGNFKTVFTDNVTAVIDSGPAGAVLGGTTTVAAVGGEAVFSTLTLDLPGTYRLRYSTAGLTSAVSNDFTVAAGAATQLAITSGAIGPQVAGVPLPAVVVEARDAAGNRATSFNGQVRALVQGVPPDSAFATAVAGVATFTGAFFETAGTFDVRFTAPGLTDALSNSFVVSPAAAARLVVTAQPSAAIAGSAIPAVTVVARDAFDNLVTAFTGPIEAVVDSGPVLGWSLGGTQTINAVLGSATFSDLTLDRASDYRLRFRSPGLDSAITTTFTLAPAAAAVLGVVEGDGQTASASTALADSIGARISDAFGNPIAGATVVWTVQAGGGSLATASGLTGADGIARNAWTLGANIGTQAVSADASGLSQVTFTATAIANNANIAWTGATSAAWSVATNWSGGVVPSPTDSVRIPAGTPFAAALDAQGLAVARLLVENGATLVLDTFPLLVNGTLDVQAGAAVLSDSIGGFALIGNGTVRGAMPRLYVQNGAYALNGALTVGGDLSVLGGTLDINANTAAVGGTFATASTGRLVMTSAPSALTVQGDAIFAGSSTSGLLTAGTLTVRGDFSQGEGAADAFSASGAHIVELDGPTAQTVTLASADAAPTAVCVASCFATLRSLRSAGTGALTFASDAKALTLMQVSGDSLYAPGQTLLSAGTPSLTSTVVVAGAVGWQTGLVRSGDFQVDTLIAWGTSQTLIASENLPTIVLGEYQVTGVNSGAIIVDGANGVLDVAGAVTVGSGSGTALRTRGNGRVRMTQTGDTLVVNGDAEFGGLTVAGEMTNGVLDVSGALRQVGTGTSFFAQGAHVTRMTGTNPVVDFGDNLSGWLANLQLDGTGVATLSSAGGGGSLTIAGTVTVGPAITSVTGRTDIGGDLIDAVGTRWQVTQTFFEGPDPVIPPVFSGAVVAFRQGVVLDTSLTVGGVLSVLGGTVDLNGHRADVGELFVTNTGVLRMANAADTLLVLGNVEFGGGSTDGQLTAGRLEVRGAFTQTTTADAFAASGTHQTWFTGGAPQTVSFANAGSGPGTSHFAALGNGQSVLSAAITLNTDVFADGMLLVPSLPGGEFNAAAGQRVVSRGADVRGALFSGAGWVLFDGGPVLAVDSVSFATQDPAAVQFEIVRNGGTIALVAPSFSTVPTTGRYLRVEDADGPTANGTLTVNVTNPSPANNGGALEPVNGAVVNGWPNFAGFNWTGAVSTDWNTSGNWAENVVPSATDSVYIAPTGVSALPLITAQTIVRSLVNDNLSPIAIDGAGIELIVRGWFTARADVAGAVCTTGGRLSVQGLNGTARIGGRVNCPIYYGFGEIALSANVTTDSTTDLQWISSGGNLTLNGFTLNSAGSFNTNGDGTLTMNNALDSLIAPAAGFDGGAETGRLTAGTILVNGNFGVGATANAFDASGAHRTVLTSGPVGTAVVNFPATPAPASRFAQLEIQRSVAVSGNAGVAGNALLWYGGAIQGAGRLAITGDFTGVTGSSVTINALEVGGVFADTGTYQADTTVFTGAGQVLPFRVGAAAVPQYRTVRVTGSATAGITGNPDSLSADLIVEGTLTVDDVNTAANIAIARDLRVRGGGRLITANQPHAILVYGAAEFAGATSDGDLATGSLRVHGDFTQLATTSARSFRPAIAFETFLDSVGTVSFADPVESRFGRLVFNWSGGVRTLLTAVNVAGVLGLDADGGATIASNVLGTGGTRQLTANGISQAGTAQLQNVALRLQGDLPVNFTTTLNFSAFDPLAVQFEIARDSGTIFVYDPIFSTTPNTTGRYLRVNDTNAADGLPLTVNVDGVATPLYHGGFAEVTAPAVLNGWLDGPNFTWTGGGTSGDWNTAANWAGGVVPSATDSVFVPAALLYNPSIPGGITLRALVSARTESPINVGGALTITERLHVPSQGGLSCPTGSVSFSNATTPMTASGYISCFVRVLDGTLTATDTLNVGENDIQVEGTAIFDAGADLVAVSGPFSTLGGGRLRMQDDSAHVQLSSGASFGGGSTAGLLTAGLLEIGGNFTQNNDPESFSASGTHTTQFSGATTQGIQFSAPGANAGFSHFANLAIGQPVGATSVDLATDAFAIGQLVAGSDPQRTFTSSGGQTLTTHGANISGATFNNVRWQLRDGALIGAIFGITFDNMDPSVSQFDVERSNGIITVSGMGFNSLPSSGVYIRVADSDGAGNGSVELAMNGTNPAGHGGAVQVVAPAQLTGWGENPPLQLQSWTGAGGDSSWENAANWSLNRTPLPADSVVIDLGGSYAVTLSSASTVRWLIVGESGTPNFAFAIGSSLQVDSGAVFGATSLVTMEAASLLTGEGAVTFGGQLTWNGGTMSGNGATLIVPGATADIATVGTVGLDTRALAIGGTANFGAAGLNATGTPTISVLAGGTLQFNATTSFFAGNGQVDLVNAGTLRKAASAGTVRVDWPIINTGTIEVADDSLDLRNTLTHLSGNVAILAGAALVNGGNTVASAPITIAAGGVMTLQSGGISADAGNHVFAPTSSISGLGWLRIDSADTTRIQGAMDIDSLTVQNGQTWFESATDTMFVARGAYLGGGDFRGSGIFGVRNTFATNGGTITGTGTMAVLPGATLTMATGTVQGWRFDIGGNMIWGDQNWDFQADPISSTWASMRLRSGSALEIQHAGQNRDIFGGTASVFTIDAGATIRKAAGTATSNFRQTLLMSGVFDVLSGTINVQGACTMTGSKTGPGALTGACGNF